MSEAPRDRDAPRPSAGPGGDGGGAPGEGPGAAGLAPPGDASSGAGGRGGGAGPADDAPSEDDLSDDLSDDAPSRWLGRAPATDVPPAPFRLSARAGPRGPRPIPAPLLGADASPPPPRPWDRVGVRLAALLALALMPLGIVGLATASAWREAAQDRASAALLGETLGAAAPTVALIRDAQGSAAALAAALDPVLDDPAACSEVMTRVLRGAPQLSIAAYVPTSGLMTCGSNGATFDYGSTPLFLQMRDEGFPAKVYVQARGPVSGVSIILAVQPVPGPGGAPRGYVALGLPHAALGGAGPWALAGDPADDPGDDPGDDRGPGAGRLPAPDFVTFNGDGTVLSTSRGFGAEAALLPGDRSLADLAREQPGTFRARTATGETRTFAVAPVLPGAVYALGSRPAREVLALGPLATAAPFLTVAAMWAATLGVAGWAGHRLVSRHMRRLAQGIADFGARGRIDEGLALDRAPGEVREVAAAFLRMAGTILRDEAELEDGLRQREALLREVHHRTRNNLQLMASIIALQVRHTRSDEARALMRGLQERVLSLAAVHRELYATAGVAEVAADELLRDIAQQAVAGGARPRTGVALDLALDRAPIGPDLAVPLALFLTEAATGALAAGAGGLRVSFGRRDGRATLAVEATGVAGEAPRQPEGHAELGRLLLGALAQQLGGTLEQDPSGRRAAVSFPLGSAA